MGIATHTIFFEAKVRKVNIVLRRHFPATYFFREPTTLFFPSTHGKTRGTRLGRGAACTAGHAAARGMSRKRPSTGLQEVHLSTSPEAQVRGRAPSLALSSPSSKPRHDIHRTCFGGWKHCYLAARGKFGVFACSETFGFFVSAVFGTYNADGRGGGWLFERGD